MFRAVKHDLLGLKDAATLRVAGPANAEHLVYLQAGFPCDHSSLEPLAARLASECGCLVGVGSMSYPSGRSGTSLSYSGMQPTPTRQPHSEASRAASGSSEE